MSEATGTALAVQNLEQLEAFLLDKEQPPEILDDPDEISREIILQLLGAEDDTELESVGAATPWQELFGVPIEIRGFNWRPSRFEQGAPIFLVVRGTRLDTGDPVVLTTSGKNVIAQLINLARRNAFPAVWQLTEAETATAAGYKPLWLVRPDNVRKAAEKEKQKA